ncbi:Probable glycine dehydrogenase (decarboxylating) subunit 2 [Geodia barretti]|uniref:glycine dehydrogenase (aminomethyl-transferring) n=1 Tax=Geodia barretti TaxID=519541 RepID=A0AA35T8G7_GEOBA|nr:Probable glycine dehydrogenase (decarboxylating) subunit 2 [Geodia barretti]
MAGFEVVTVASDDKGNMDLEALHELAGADLAGVMITQSSTLGLFDTGIVDMCRVVHEAGGLVYGDGANMNALLGRVKLGDLGFDIIHLNLHKTFSTPHGGGGPGAGPVCVGDTLLPYLPAPVVTQAGENGGITYNLHYPERTIGKTSGFHGNFGVLVRAYTYTITLGAAGLKAISGNAVLNANYLMQAHTIRLKDFSLLAFDRVCYAQRLRLLCRLAEGPRRQWTGDCQAAVGLRVPRAHDVLPLIVHEALMIEPTESETRETLDAFIEAMRAIDREIGENPELVRSAPHTRLPARFLSQTMD